MNFKTFFVVIVLIVLLGLTTSSTELTFVEDYCIVGQDCTLNDLFLTGNFTFLGDIINVTILNQNITGQLDIGGSLNVDGNVTADNFFGDGSLLSNLPNSSLWNKTKGGIVLNNINDTVGIGFPNSGVDFAQAQFHIAVPTTVGTAFPAFLVDLRNNLDSVFKITEGNFDYFTINTGLGHMRLMTDIGAVEIASTLFVNNSQVGIGTSTPLSIADFYIFSEAGSDGIMGLGDADVDHGMTGLGIETSTVALWSPILSVSGGMLFSGFTDLSSTALRLDGTIGVEDPTDSTAAVEIRGFKKSATIRQALGNDKTVFAVNNGGGANNFVILGDGDVGIGTTTPSQKLDVAGFINVTGEDTSNSTFQGDVKIIGKLSGGSLLDIGGINVTGEPISFMEHINQSSRFTLQNTNNGSNASAAMSPVNNVGGSMSIFIGSDRYMVGTTQFFNATALVSRTKGIMAFVHLFDETFKWFINTQDDNDPNNIVEMMSLDKSGVNITNNLTVGGILKLPTVLELSAQSSTTIRRKDDTGEVGIKVGVQGSDVGEADHRSGAAYVWIVENGTLNYTIDLHSSLDPNNPNQVVHHLRGNTIGEVWRLDNPSAEFFRWETKLNGTPLLTLNRTGLFAVNNSFWITSVGNVGIGLPEPQKDFHISSTVPTIRLSDSDAATDQAVATLIEFYQGDNTNRVGFLAMASASNDILKLSTDYTNGELRFGTGDNADRVTIDKDGNVGIGITNPGSKLHIIGDVNITGDIILADEKFITTDTIDGTDDESIGIAGGGSLSNLRGSFIRLAGNEDGNTGKMFLTAGNVVGGIIRMSAGGITRIDITDDEEIIIGTSSKPANFTMFSVDGSSFECGVNNAGTFACV